MRVGIRCDAGPATGVGHLIRCIALAEELVGRGAEVTFLTNTGGVAWAAAQLAACGVRRAPAPASPAELVAAATAHRLEVVIIDSYQLDPGSAAALRDGGFLVVVIIDGTARGQVADIYLDQNLGAEDGEMVLPAGMVRLAGVRYALLRDRIRSLRPARPGVPAPDRAPAGRRPPPSPSPALRPAVRAFAPAPDKARVVCFFGGTDAFGAAPVLTRLLVETGAACEATVVAGSPALRDDLAAVRPGPGQAIEVIGPTDALAEICAAADLAISAAGTSTWELLCLGTPAALVQVAENQRAGYQQVVTRGLAAGLGRLDQLPNGDRSVPAAAILHQLLTSAHQRAAMGARGWATVDGNGRERVVDEIERMVRSRNRPAVRSGR